MLETYLSLNLQIIPIVYNSKRPFFKNWYKNYNVEKCRKTFATNQANYGLLLGKIVDVEGDTIEANNIIRDLTRSCKHPIFKSNKSYHHLFLNPDPNLTIWTHYGIEFRGYKHQSILPPSKIAGQEYTWVNMSFPIPLMPEKLKLFYFKNSLKPNHVQIVCPICKKKIFIHEKCLYRERKVFGSIGFQWTCRKCRPFLIN